MAVPDTAVQSAHTQRQLQVL